jgi:hypothetical protein
MDGRLEIVLFNQNDGARPVMDVPREGSSFARPRSATAFSHAPKRKRAASHLEDGPRFRSLDQALM